VLKRAGVRHHVYHKAVTQEAREAALEAMMAAAAAADGSSSSDGSSSGSSDGNVVVVCTDAAARGIDLPAVTHVVQADFATNAVDFLHRAGRTARAGRGGRVTSIVGPKEAVLAAALRERVEAGLPVEGCFSRNRSLRHKLRKYGEFVPRGEVGPASGGGGGR
jgi:superfamily II DNA/RNA helicase